MTDKRVVILEDGQVTIGGVVCKLVPVEPTEVQYKAWQESWPTHGNFQSRFRTRYTAMLPAAAHHQNLYTSPRRVYFSRKIEHERI